MTGINVWIMLGTLLPIIFIFAITPLITRKTEAFGITIPEGVKEQSYIQGHIKRYILICIILGVIMLAGIYFMLQLQLSEEAATWSYVAATLAYALITFAVYYVSHRSIKEWKQKQEWYKEQPTGQRIVVQTDFHQKRRAISIAWYIPHFLVVAATTAYSLIRYDDFPEQLPMKYSLTGEVVSTVEKSIQSVLSLSFVAFALVIVFLFSHFSIIKSKQVVEGADPEGSIERNRIFRYAWSVYLAIAAFLVVLLMCIGQLSPLQLWEQRTFLIYSAFAAGLVLLGAMILSVKLGQGGSRIVLPNQKGEAKVETADLDQYWKAGVFYSNPKDPAIFVEKRFGIGWTINIANPLSWLVFIGILAIVLVPSIFLS